MGVSEKYNTLGLDRLWRNIVIMTTRRERFFPSPTVYSTPTMCRHRTVTKSNQQDPLSREAHHLAGETKMQAGSHSTVHSALRFINGDAGGGGAEPGHLTTCRVIAGCTPKPLCSVVLSHSSLSPSLASLCERAHVLWQAERAVGCLTNHLLLLLVWGGAG